MHPRCTFDYAVIRVVPRVERGEFLNVGIVLFCPTEGFLEARVAFDEARLLALAPDLDLALIRSYLDAIPRIAHGGADAGPIGALPQRARFHWLVAPRSTVIQMSPVHAGVGDDLNAAMDSLMTKLVR